MQDKHEQKKIVAAVATLAVLVVLMSLAFFRTRGGPDSPDSEASSGNSALDSEPSVRTPVEVSDEDFPTPSGWEKLSSVTSDTEPGAPFPTPSGWEKVDSATASANPSEGEPMAPQLLPPPISPGSLPAADADGTSTGSNGSSKHFPTEQRVWTNYKGQLMVASVIECDFDSGNLLMESDRGILRRYQLTQLSDADRAYLWNLAEQK